MIADLLFLMFASVLVIAALGVISAKNPMYCVLFLVLAFLNAAGLFILLGAEFLGLLMIMVYVGAIAVMFLFVLMTVDIDMAVMKQGFAEYMPMGLLVAAVLFAEILAGVWGGMFSGLPEAASVPDDQPQNAVQLGMVLFTDYAAPFLVVSLILLVAMVGAIVLTFRRRTGVKRQDIGKQINRKVEDAMVLTSPKSGEGVTSVHWEGKGV